MARPPKNAHSGQTTLIDLPSTPTETPLMKQYYAMKAQYPGALMLFRVGDFYETFGEDAVEVSKVLSITLTKRNNGGLDVELAGFPHHALDTYLPKLVRAGKRVAVCDQLEDPATAKGIVKRGVTEIASPGVTLNDKVLEAHKSNYLAAVWLPDKNTAGLAFAELSTGDFFCCSGDWKYADKLLSTLQPSEVLVSRAQKSAFDAHFPGTSVTRLEDWIFMPDYAREKLTNMFRSASLKGFGIEDEAFGIIAAGAVVHYLNENQQRELGQFAKIYRYDDSEYVWLDRFTVRNLELVQPLNPDGVAVVDVLDKTSTPMGARLLRRAMVQPLKDLAGINRRLDTVEAFHAAGSRADDLAALLRRMGDLERLVSKTATLRLRPREATLMRDSLALLPEIAAQFSGISAVLAGVAARFEDTSAPQALLQQWLMPEVSQSVADGDVIAAGVSPELDDLRNLRAGGHNLLLRMQQREIERTGITSLKISYNKVFGYYIEVTNAHKNRVPSEWVRKQTLTGAERYITEELKQYEDKILSAQDRILTLENSLYLELVNQLQPYLHPIQRNAALIAECDMLLSFALVARVRQYVRPHVHEGDAIAIRQGRHPVIEVTLPADKPYVPNDVLLNNSDQQVIIVTGPNMGGKSSLLRQTALITLLAQMGCFVPAEAAEIGLVDKVFTRVGASDNIAGGESTFMVEMNETAQIANNATDRSLILLDEIGRGTSTYDGVSIAWALVEYLHNTVGQRSKTLFATHYHELNELQGRLERVRNYHVSVREVDNRILFLRKLVPGGSEHSFGIHVAEMAGMPPELIQRAHRLLAHFEANRMNDREVAGAIRAVDHTTVNMQVFELRDELLLRIQEVLGRVDVNRITPVEALLKLQELKVIVG